MSEDPKLATIERVADNKITIALPAGTVSRIRRAVPLEDLLKVLSPDPSKPVDSAVEYPVNTDQW
jgi:hypothetical protein